MIPVGVKHVIDIRTQKAEQATNTRVSKRNQYLHQSASIVEAWLNESPPTPSHRIGTEGGLPTPIWTSELRKYKIHIILMSVSIVAAQ